MEHGLVTDIAICIIAAWIVAVASQVARQPLLLAYLVAGFAIGPHGFQWITDTHSIADHFRNRPVAAAVHDRAGD